MNQPLGSSSLQSRLHKHRKFASRLVDEKHDFIVYVPQAFNGYPNRFFPVLYLHDGQNLFDPETSFIKGNYWRVGETADTLIESGEVEPLVIVGIYNTGVKRIDDYTPVEDRRLGGGRADAYGQMLVEELKPFVAHQYRTLAGPENCGMGGSSLGGLVSLYLGMRYPDVFGNLAIFSPSVWWYNRAILDGGPTATGYRATHLARHWHERGPTGASRHARSETSPRQEGLETREELGVSRDRRWQAQRVRLGRTGRAHVEVPVSAETVSLESQWVAVSGDSNDQNRSVQDDRRWSQVRGVYSSR